MEIGIVRTCILSASLACKAPSSITLSTSCHEVRHRRGPNLLSPTPGCAALPVYAPAVAASRASLEHFELVRFLRTWPTF